MMHELQNVSKSWLKVSHISRRITKLDAAYAFIILEPGLLRTSEWSRCILYILYNQVHTCMLTSLKLEGSV